MMDPELLEVGEPIVAERDFAKTGPHPEVGAAAGDVAGGTGASGAGGTAGANGATDASS